MAYRSHAPPTTLLRETSLLTAARLIGRLGAVALLPAIVAMVALDGYGVWTQLFVSQQLLAQLIGLKLSMGLIRWGSALDPAPARELWRATLGPVVLASAGVSLACLLGAPWVARALFDTASLAPLIGVLAAMSVSSALQQHAYAWLRISQKHHRHAVLQVGQAVLEVAAIAVGFLVLRDIAAAGWLVTVVRVGLFVIAAPSLVPAIPTTTEQRATLRTVVAHSLPIIPNTLLQWATNYADRIVIVQMLGLRAVGAYATAYALASALAMLPGAVGVALYPRLAKRWSEGDESGARAQLGDAARAVAYVVVAGGAGLAVVGPSFVAVLTSGEATLGHALFALLGLGIALEAATLLLSYRLHLLERPGSISGAFGVALAVNIALNLLLVPAHGLVGAAMATAAAFAASAFAILARTRDRWPSAPAGPWALRLSLVGACAAVPAIGFAAASAAGLAAAIAAGVACWAVAMAALHRAGWLPEWQALRIR